MHACTHAGHLHTAAQLRFTPLSSPPGLARMPENVAATAQVERIVVANHTTARVVMKEPVDLRSMADGSNTLGGGETMASRSEVCVGLGLGRLCSRAMNGVTIRHSSVCDLWSLNLFFLRQSHRDRRCVRLSCVFTGDQNSAAIRTMVVNTCAVHATSVKTITSRSKGVQSFLLQNTAAAPKSVKSFCRHDSYSRNLVARTPHSNSRQVENGPSIGLSDLSPCCSRGALAQSFPHDFYFSFRSTRNDAATPHRGIHANATSACARRAQERGRGHPEGGFDGAGDWAKGAVDGGWAAGGKFDDVKRMRERL